MSREKQIEEMAKVLKGMDRLDEAKFGFYESYARAIYNAGYRKSTDLAEEIFAEIGKILRRFDEIAERDKSEYGELIVGDIGCAIADLKKKYFGEDTE